MASRRRSSVIATIVIPDSLLRAASVSGPAASISNHNSSAGISSRQNTLDAIPDEPEGLPTDRSRSIVIIEPQPARLEDTRQASYTSAGEITLMDTNHDIFRSFTNYSMNKAEVNGTLRLDEDLDEGPHWVEVAEPLPPVRFPVSGYAGAESRRHTAASISQPFEVSRARRLSRAIRKGSIYEVYEKAKLKGLKVRRERWAQLLFEYTFYLVLISFIYFLLIGMPLWDGAVRWLHYAVENSFKSLAGFLIVLGLAIVYAFAPLVLLFEKDPIPVAAGLGLDGANVVYTGLDTALLIPCYKSATLIKATLEAALKVFPASSIFVIANGNSPTPLDNTEDVCLPYGVNHIWSPIGSKIIAQFVGCYAAKSFKNVLLIDDDCLIPPDFPIVSERLTGRVKSIGYLIKSVGPNSSRGNWCQQAQDMEYKISGLQRVLAGKLGSATFPHGAISLWDRDFLVKVFSHHPGFSISEDWFFGHSCRSLGGRIKMCSAVFVETETPPALFFSSSGGSRGGFGEMTVFKQRFMRWNFFFVTSVWYNMSYILGSWRLGWWEIGSKLAVFQEVYETLLYLFTPFILPMSVAVNPAFWAYVLVGTVFLYFLNVLIFNELHLRLKNERVSWTVLIIYYMGYKVLLTFVNVASCYWSIYKYARYFAQRYPKVVEDEKAVAVVLSLEEEPGGRLQSVDEYCLAPPGGRRFTVTALPSNASV